MSCRPTNETHSRPLIRKGNPMPTDAKSAVILVVDDNPSSLYSTCRVLRSAGWAVEEATTGQECLNRVASGVDLVVLDVNLPDINGFEVCRLIREREATQRVAVIHLSASFVNTEARVHGLESGADGYLTHPVEPPVLIATVNAFLRARRVEAEREELLARERAAREEAERANRFKDDFLATLSHELRTPLNAIVGWAQLLQMKSCDENDLKEGLEAIERNARVQSQMIADLLDVSRITSGKLRLDAQPVDAASVVEAALTAIMPAAAAKSIRVVKDIDFHAGSISGDPSRLQQIVWNLVQNAVKFTPKEGSINVALGRSNSYMEIRVSDTGQGIKPDLLPRIFERFQQGDSTMTRSHSGLGLGLAIVKQLVELHGGSITAESPGEGQGATFIVLLPIPAALNIRKPVAALSEDAQKTAINGFKPIDLSGLRVLLVDDETDARRVVSRIVEECGAQATGVASAKDALDILDLLDPHVLVSDLGMPRADGFALIEEIRARGHSAQKLPAIALTAFVRPEDRRRALVAGFQVHLSKPVDPQELASAIATLAAKPR
jgi:signal transduction histidine kinase